MVGIIEKKQLKKRKEKHQHLACHMHSRLPVKCQLFPQHFTASNTFSQSSRYVPKRCPCILSIEVSKNMLLSTELIVGSKPSTASFM